MTSVYWVNFFVAGRQRQITRREIYIYIGALSAVRVILGLFVSGRLFLDGNYSVLGY